jgi:hypothetical protein
MNQKRFGTESNWVTLIGGREGKVLSWPAGRECGIRNEELGMWNELARRDDGRGFDGGSSRDFKFRIPNLRSRESRATLAADYFSGGADLRSHSATPLRPTCLSKAARMRRKEASWGLVLIRSHRQAMESYQKPREAFRSTLDWSQLKSTSISTRQVLNSQRSMMPPATMSCDGESGLRIAEMYQRYCTSGSSARPRSFRLRDWMPACSGVGTGPS